MTLYKEHSKGFYLPSHSKDVATDLTMEDIIVLKNPKQGYNKELKLLGCDFGANIKNDLKHWFSKT